MNLIGDIAKRISDEFKRNEIPSVYNDFGLVIINNYAMKKKDRGYYSVFESHRRLFIYEVTPKDLEGDFIGEWDDVNIFDMTEKIHKHFVVKSL